jgi:hypothetical protein
MLRTNDNKSKNSECSQDSTTSEKFYSNDNNKKRKRLREYRKNLGGGYGLEDKILHNFLPPSSFATPVFLNGAQEPALCFGSPSLKWKNHMNATVDNLSELKLCSQNQYAVCTNRESQLLLDRSIHNLEPYLPSLLKSTHVEVTKVPNSSETECCKAFSFFEGSLSERQALAEKVGSKSETLYNTLQSLNKDSLISIVKEKVEGIFDAIHAGKRNVMNSRQLLQPSALNSPSVIASCDINDDHQQLLCNEFEDTAMRWQKNSSTSDDFPLPSRQEADVLHSLSMIVRSTAFQLVHDCNK